MNANIKRMPRRRKDVLPSTPFGELPLSGDNTEHETGVSAPSHSPSDPPPKSGEALPAVGQSVSAEESSPAPGPDAGPNSAPSAATPSLLAEPSLQVPGEGSVAATVGADLSKALTVPERAKLLLKSEQTEKDLRALLEDSQRITVITNPDGRSQAHAILMRHVRARTALDDADKVAREDMIALTKGVIDEKKRLAAINAEDEKRIRELRDAWDKKIEDEKRARAEAEQRRKDAIEARIEEMRNRVADAIGKSAADVAALIEQTTSIAIDDAFAEFKSRAESAQKMTLEKLRYFHQSAVAAEEKARELAEQEARLADERAELARQRAAEEVRLAQERERLAEEQRQAKKAADAEAARQAEVLRRQRAEQEAEAARVLAEQEAAAARERARIEEDDRQAKLKREAEESAHQEQLRRQREENERAAAERQKALAEEEARFAAQKAAQEAYERQQAEAREIEEARLADQRAELERQQEALRLAQEAVTKPTDPVEATAAEDVQPAPTSARAEAPERPSDEEIIEVVTQAFFVSEDVAWEWIAEMDVERRKAA